MDMEKWHARTVAEAINFWLTSPDEGLNTQEVKNRLHKFGNNQLTEKEKPAKWRRFVAQFQDFMVLVLLAATLISAFLGEYADAVTILAIVMINAVLGFVQECRAEQSMEALKKLSAPTARVLRNSTVQHIPANEIVPGDILVLEAGDKLAADGRLIETGNLEAEEAALTGESLPVRKISDREYQEESPLGDRKNMVYAATSITKGRGKAVVCATGMATEVGRIAGLIQDAEEEATPLEKRLENLGKVLVWGCLGICLVVMLIGVLKGEALFLMLMAGISLAVAAIPEGLPAIVTVCLALGVQRMIKRNSIIRKLPAVETLGCTTVICSDKTGTLTQNAMTARQIFTGGRYFDVSGVGYGIIGDFLLDKQEFEAKKDKFLMQCLTIGALCNNSTLKRNQVNMVNAWRKSDRENGWSVEGDPTEGALVVAAAKAGIWRLDLEKNWRRTGEVPFEADRRRMSVIYRRGGDFCLYVKGAPDTVLDLCRYQGNGDQERPLTPELVAAALAANDQMTSKALRVLAVAYRKLSPGEAEKPGEHLERELVFVGLIGMIDPPRDEVKQAIGVCRRAGIKTVMISGDHPNTAVAIAAELQMYKEGVNRSLTGVELDKITDNELAKIVNSVSVFARVSPAHKLRIVKALKKSGHIVAMTGDGVNDAPAVKEADIGIAMGITGTDVTKEASSMVLADDNFASIVAAVEEGRGIYDNIRKFIRYLLSCNIGEVLTMFLAAIAGLPLPLLPVQILWVNLVTDGLPAMALGVDPNDADIMNRPPRNPGESVFSRGLSRKIILRGIQIGLSTLAVFSAIYFMKQDLALARTATFCTLVFCQMFHVFDCRSETLTIFEAGFFRNRYLVMAVACSTLMQLSVIYIPFLREIFQTVPLSIGDWALVLIVSGWTFLMAFFRQLFGNKRRYSHKTVFTRV